MKVKDLLDQVELELTLNGRQKMTDRMVMLKHLRYDLDVLLAMEDWDWAAKYLDPVISTVDDKRDYDLPADFGDNFMRGARTDGTKRVCKLDDGTCQVLLTYESPAIFYSRDLSVEDSSKPTRYTITNKPDGNRQISLSPPPDDNGDDNYQILGLYIPKTWEIHFESALPPIPRNGDVLKWMVLKRFDQKYDPTYASALATLYMSEAKQHDSRFVPVIQRY